MSIQLYLWRGLLKFLKASSISSWDLRGWFLKSSSSSSEVRQNFSKSSSEAHQKFVKFIKFVKFVRTSSKVRQVRRKFVKFVGGLGGGPNWESKQLLFLIVVGKAVFFDFWWQQLILLTNLTNFWKTSDELLTNFWRTSDELLTNLTNFWLHSQIKTCFLWVVVKSQPLAHVFCFFQSAPLKTSVGADNTNMHCRSDRIVGRFRLQVIIWILATHSYTFKFYLTAWAASQHNPIFWHAGPKKCYWCRVHSGFGYNVSVPVVPHKAVAEVSKIGNL